MPLFPRLGVRTQHEIEVERIALKILHGDFNAISHQVSVPQAVQAAELRGFSRLLALAYTHPHRL